jgi:hypothetical protein
MNVHCRLNNYLTLVLGASATATSFSSAAIVDIDITALGIGGVNGGVASGQKSTLYGFPVGSSGALDVYNGNRSYTGLDGDFGLEFAANNSYASPINFSAGATIGDGSNFSGFQAYTVFFYQGYPESPAFGSGSYMGFKTAEGQYGWLEVTWDPTTDEFEILDGAYESEAGVAILAGAQGVSAVPEPTGALSLLALIGGGSLLRRRKGA